jgi:hypothetical protein
MHDHVVKLILFSHTYQILFINKILFIYKGETCGYSGEVDGS